MKENKNFTVAVTAFLSLLVFNSIVPAQQESVVPIATTYYLLGGSKNGKWLTAETVAPLIKKETKMVLIDVKGIVKGGGILTDSGEEYGACGENKAVRLEPEIESGIVAVGDNAKWNLVPRIPKSIAVTDKSYVKIAADFLKTKGIARTKIKLSQIVQIDLEGDGKYEIIIAGNYYKKGTGEEQNAGDYSFALLRKTVNGKPQNILLGGDFFTAKLLRSGEFDPPNVHNINALADLNGDGKMEIVLGINYYEGDRNIVFEMKNGKPIKVLELECSV